MEFPAYQEYQGYHGIQVTDLPAMAKDGAVTIRGNNQAFFFRDEVKENGQVIDIVPNEERMKTLLREIYAQGDNREERTKFTMAIDADVMKPLKLSEALQSSLNKPVTKMPKEEKNALGKALKEHPAIKKYAEYRGEEPPVNIILFAKEIAVIQNYVNEGGICRNMYEIVNEASPSLPENRKNVIVDGLAEKNFRLMEIEMPEAMKSATWEADLRSEHGTTQDQLLAMQDYPNQTHHLNRPWRVGTREAVMAISANPQHENYAGAKILTADVEEMMTQVRQGRNLSQIPVPQQDQGTAREHRR